MLAISYFTKNTPYEQEILRLKKSLDDLRMSYNLVGITDTGYWEKNCAKKPEIILKILEDYKPSHILFVDADAEILKKPIFPNTCDLACYYHHGVELSSATLFMANNKKIHALLKLWIKLSTYNLKVWDQKILQKIIENDTRHIYLNFSMIESTVDYLVTKGIDDKLFINSLGLKVFSLPQEFCCIIGQKCEDPIILQHQASRRYKRLINHV